MNVRTVSIICPLFNEEKFIERCILSILEQDYPQDKLEVLLIDGRSTDHTADIVRRYTEKYPFIKLLDNPERVVPYALNKGLEAATGEVIMRIDGHCTYPTNYISELVRYLYELDADNVGGVWNTQPANDTAVCHAIALASSHPFGVGGSMHKIGASKIMETDTVPFGCYKREVFEKTGLFDTDLVRNQDDEFNGRLQNLGGKIFLIPQVIIAGEQEAGSTCHHQAVLPSVLPALALLRRNRQHLLTLGTESVCSRPAALPVHQPRGRYDGSHPHPPFCGDADHALHLPEHPHELWFRL